jgi:hypothetical protein
MIDQGMIDQGTIDQGTIDQGTTDQGMTERKVELKEDRQRKRRAPRRPSFPVGQPPSEVKLQRKLKLTRRLRGGDEPIAARMGELRMIEQVQEIRSELQLHALR